MAGSFSIGLCLLALLVSGSAWGQSFLPAGLEYGLTVPLSGDQMEPCLAVGPNGGWAVWQGNISDKVGNGLEVVGARIDSSFGVAGNRFRINQIVTGDQESPAATLLRNGNLLVAWEGGTVAHQIYARFLSPPSTFLTGDIQLTTKYLNLTNLYQTNAYWWYTNNQVLRQITTGKIDYIVREESHHPAVATTTNGNAVVVYSGARRVTTQAVQIDNAITYSAGRLITNSIAYWVTNRCDDMDEIFFQILGPTGTKLIGERVVNQFKTFNQRRPAVAGLANGNFVVVWVSEQGFALAPDEENYVVIAGRIFDAAGRAVGDEFRIDGQGPAVCTQPAVSASSDGGFIVAWNQRDRHSRANGLDVYARVFRADGSPAAPAFRVNSFVAGNQYAPKIGTAGADHLVVWNSVGQDGSMEGIYGRQVSEGVLAGNEFCVNTTKRNKQLQPAVACMGANWMLVTWANYASIATGFDLMAQKFGFLPAVAALEAPTVTATGPNSLFVDWAEVASDLQKYALYQDGAAEPILVSQSSWTATGLEPGSTHSFRVAYTLNNGSRSKLSVAGFGTTLPGDGNSAGTGTTNDPGTGSFTNPDGTGDGQLTRLMMSLNGNKVSLQWNSEPGAVYQLQTSTNLSTWINLGSPRTATDAVTTQSCDAEDRGTFFRVLRVQP